MKKDYSKFQTKWIKTPAQFGHMSKDERPCLWLGQADHPTSPIDGCYLVEFYKYNSRFLRVEHLKRMTTGSDGLPLERRFTATFFTTYVELPDEIKAKIEVTK